MQLEEYFEFVSADEILLRGTRVGIEAILTEYLEGALPEGIVVNYPPVSLEQVYATIIWIAPNMKRLMETQTTDKADNRRVRRPALGGIRPWPDVSTYIRT